MFANDITVNGVGANVQFFAQNMSESSGIQHGAGTHNSVLRKTTEFPGNVGHDID